MLPKRGCARAQERKEKAILKRSRLAMLSLIMFFILTFPIVGTRTSVGNPAILHVSIPAGEDRTGIFDPDKWLCECWLFNINGTSGTFTVEIEDVSGRIWSYDTHLVIALNDAAYNNLVSLTVDTVTIVKNDFQYGSLNPYNLRNWPSGDVYPTWFNDTLVNVGTIPPKGHTNVTVSVTLTNVTGARMHFDACGRNKESSTFSPTKKRYITCNPLSEDSTVLFWPPPLIPPVACFSVSNVRPNVCETVTFNATCSYDPDGYIVKYEWDMDGNGVYDLDAGNNSIAYHHYDPYGYYYPKLRVTDNDGVTDQTNITIHVRQHPVARFYYLPPSPRVGELVTFNGSLSTPDGGTIVSYEWDFGDTSSSVFGKTVNHTYSTYGTFTVTLNVTDSEGKWDTESKNVTVWGHPQADFTWSPLSPQVGETVTFNASTSTPNGGTIISYVWDFGESNSSTGKIVNHTYATFGNYTVTLNVTDSEGKWDVVSRNLTVREHPHADFTWSPISPQIGESVTFDASASTPDGGTIVSYTWDFGDSNITSVTGPIITHRYTAPGDYYIALTITDSENKSDTTDPPITLTITPLEYYLTVRTDPLGLGPAPTPSSNWYINCTYVTITASEYANVSADTRYRFYYWDVNGTSQGVNVKNITVHMDANYTATAHYVPQYLVIFDHTGLDSTANSTVVTINGAPKNFSDLPFSEWVNNSSWINYLYNDIVSSSTPGKRFSLVEVTGPASPISIMEPVTVAGNYKTQYYLTVVSPYDTPGGMGWYNSSKNAYAILASDIVDHGNGTRRVFTHWGGHATGTNYAKSDPIHMDGPKTAIANWNTHYLLIVRTDPPWLIPQPTRNPAGEPGPGGWWYDSSTDVQLTSHPVARHEFLYWDVDGTPRGGGVKQINVHMNEPHVATASFEVSAPPIVGGYVAPIEIATGKEVSHLPTSQIGLAFALLAAMAVTIILTKRRSKRKRALKTPRTP